MKTDRTNGIVITGAAKWDPENVDRLEHRVSEIAGQYGHTEPHIRVTLEHDQHGHRFGASLHFTARRRTLHAYASGTSEEQVITRIDRRLSALLDRERQRHLHTHHHFEPGVRA